MVFTSRSRLLRSGGVVFVIVAVSMISWWVVTSSGQLAVKNLPVAAPPPVASAALTCLSPLPLHEPVRLRLGTITALGATELTLSTVPLPGEVGDTLKVELTADTPVVEVRVPSYLGEERRQELQNGGRVIERVPVAVGSLYAGQPIAVISTSDTYCQATVVPERLEYEVIINTEKEL